MMGWGYSGGCGFGLGHMGSGGIWGGGLLGILVSGLGLLLALGLLAVLIVAVAWLVRRLQLSATPAGYASQVSPLDLARRRLAAGELSLEEYHRLRDNLER